MDEQVELLRGIWNEMKALNGRVDATNVALNDGLGGLRAELHDGLGGLRAELHDEIGTLGAKLHQAIGGLRSGVKEEFFALRLDPRGARRTGIPAARRARRAGPVPLSRRSLYRPMPLIGRRGRGEATKTLSSEGVARVPMLNGQSVKGEPGRTDGRLSPSEGEHSFVDGRLSPSDGERPSVDGRLSPSEGEPSPCEAESLGLTTGRRNAPRASHPSLLCALCALCGQSHSLTDRA